MFINRSAIKNAYLNNKSNLVDIIEIVRPLKKFDVIDFCYAKFKDTTRLVELMSNHSYIDRYLKNLDKYPDHDFIENNLSRIANYPNNFCFGFLPEVEENNLILHDTIACGMKSAITFFNRSLSKNEIEIFTFSFDASYEELVKKLQYLTIFKEFTCHFKDKAHQIIQSSVKKNLKFLPKETPNALSISNKDKTLNSSAFSTNRYYLQCFAEDIYLTKKELLYLKHYLNGLSVKEIAIALNLSRRTVETHLQNVRAKAKIKNLHQLRQQLGNELIF